MIVSPQFLGLWDPFQMAMNMAEINGGDPNYHLLYLGSHPLSTHVILLMAEILHQFIGSLSHYL